MYIQYEPLTAVSCGDLQWIWTWITVTEEEKQRALYRWSRTVWYRNRLIIIMRWGSIQDEKWICNLYCLGYWYNNVKE